MVATMLMDSPFIIILKTLEPAGIGSNVNISPILLSMFPLRENAENYEIQNISRSIVDLLVNMEKENLILLPGNTHNKLAGGIGGHIDWLTDIKIIALITTHGLNYLTSDRNQKTIKQVNQSVINTNTATKRNFQRQLIISILVIIISALTAWISWLTYQKTKASDDLEKRLNTLEKNIPLQTTHKQASQPLKVFQPNLHQKKDST